ncbi:hypothetical protein TruAng_011635 [Truncatella angustata]|nr:hypothetical protein TruAng_011635 [Truncatella angustata]
MSESPIGPFKRQDKILQQDSAVAKGSGHHGIINVPGTDIWYIVYHRRPLSESDGNHRVLAYDRMFFNANDTIVPVRMLVQDNFADGNMIAWKTYGCDWFVVEERLTASNSSTGLAMLDTNFESLSFEATVNLSKSNASDAEAGVIFRAELQDDAGSFQGYFAGVTASGDIVLTYSHALNGTDVLARNSTEILHLGHEHRLRVTGTGNSIQIFLGDSKTPKIDTQVPDGYRSSGANGVRVYKAAAKFGSISITRLGDGL